MTEALVRVTASVPAALAEEARAKLLGLAPQGFQEADAGSVVELSVYIEEPGVESVCRAFPGALVEPVEPGWEESWREFHRPAEVGGLWLGPPWIQPPRDLPAVVIDPGRAFGTGAHATTRVCIELIAGIRPGSLLDVGCGSGVLSLAAARLGFGPIVALDDDPVAVDVTRENARRNDVTLEVLLADALLAELPGADVAVANVELGMVKRLLERLPARTAVTSGYLASERPMALGWKHSNRLELDGWAADAFVRRNP